MAKKNLAEFNNIKFIQGAVENIKLKGNDYDAVFSCFLFHELPLPIRNAICKQSRGYLKKNGFFGIVDSIQKNDDLDLEWALDQFPIDFHEPFFKNYINSPLPKILKDNDFKSVSTEIGFLSKVVYGIK